MDNGHFEYITKLSKKQNIGPHPVCVTSNTTKWADRTLKHAFPSKKKIAFTFLQKTKFCEGKC
jgi:hypothetical protein